jgi:hypothetical protein
VDGKVEIVKDHVGTRSEHYLVYLSDAMDVLDNHNMKGHYIVMDNAPIHTPAVVQNLVEEKG